jgi:hypothetical protein
VDAASFYPGIESRSRLPGSYRVLLGKNRVIPGKYYPGITGVIITPEKEKPNIFSGKCICKLPVTSYDIMVSYYII